MLNYYLTQLEHDADKAEWSREVHEIKVGPFQFSGAVKEADLVQYATPKGFEYLRHDADRFYFRALPFSKYNLTNQIFAVMFGRKIPNTSMGRKELSALISPLIPLEEFHIEASIGDDDNSLNIDIKTQPYKPQGEIMGKSPLQEIKDAEERLERGLTETNLRNWGRLYGLGDKLDGESWEEYRARILEQATKKEGGENVTN